MSVDHMLEEQQGLFKENRFGCQASKENGTGLK